jgi:hypothetical protein
MHSYTWEENVCAARLQFGNLIFEAFVLWDYDAAHFCVLFMFFYMDVLPPQALSCACMLQVLFLEAPILCVPEARVSRWGSLAS